MGNKRSINLIFSLGILVIAFTAMAYVSLGKTPEGFVLKSSNGNSTMWKYQCIDTMKTSRDKARAWSQRIDIDEHIEKEVSAIKNMGANCIAIATPYDLEFKPYLDKWVAESRRQDLHIWFRGNFSSWEGWFEYPKGMTEEELFSKTRLFILSNPDLFRDGDIFTAAPEAENGGPFNQVEKDEHEAYRKFLIRKHEVTELAFKEIEKDVVINWFSMNGGLAKRMMDQNTVDNIGNTVTIDHYIKTSEEMSEFITYFHNKFGAKVVIGEFGAPIPEINGEMTPEEQAEFVDDLFKEIYINQHIVEGVSYWILYDGSTALLDNNLEPLPVFSVVEKYFKPKIISGTIKNTAGKPVGGVLITSSNNLGKTTTDSNGKFTLKLPREDTTIKISGEGYESISEKISKEKQHDTIKIALVPTQPGFLYKIKSFLF